MPTTPLEGAMTRSLQYALENSYLVALEAATPKKTRITSRSWKVEETGTPGKFKLVNTALTRNKKYSIVKLLEEGTDPHVIRAKNAKALHWQKGSKHFFAKQVQHPGFEGRQFVKKTLNNVGNDERFQRQLAIQFKKELKALR